MDEDLRTLERALQENPDDKAAEAKYRLACVRQGNQEKAKPVQVGDTITITESENPWINGTWEGKVIKIDTDGSSNIKPTSLEPDYRVKPSPEYLTSGLYMTDVDLKTATIVRPVIV